MQDLPIGILGYGLYLPEGRVDAGDVAAATQGRFTEQAVREKLGIHQKTVPAKTDGTQEMGARAALDALRRTGVRPEEIGLILCVGEEHKEYPLTTSGIYIQERIGARNAWAIDVQQRCNSTVAALKMARDLMCADTALETVLIAGGYRNGDLIDYRDPTVSFMYNLAAGGGALVLRRGHAASQVMGTEIKTDGSLARAAGVEWGGTECDWTSLGDTEWNELREKGNRSLRVFDPDGMRDRLNEVSMANWLSCIDGALAQSGGLTRSDIDYLNVLHFKPSMHRVLLDKLGLSEEQSVYLSNYGHVGQVDAVLSMHEGLRTGRLKDGDLMVIVAAGIGYVWGASVVRWGSTQN